ncbi:antibiotic biosynthesis monooxygenase, partial [bacterium]
VKPEERVEYVTAFTDFVRATRQEAGCLDVIIAADPIEAGRINIFELWESKEQMDAFRAKAEPPEVSIEIETDEVKKYEISAVGPPFP